MGDVANLMGQYAGEFIGELRLFEQGREEEYLPAGQREGIGNVGSHHIDAGRKGRPALGHGGLTEPRYGAVGEAVGIGITQLKAAQTGLHLGGDGGAQPLLPIGRHQSHKAVGQ